MRERESKPEVKEPKKVKICSSFDEDCENIENHVGCFIGNKYCGVADGICPFIHRSN